MADKIKPVWVVCGMDGYPLTKEDSGDVREFSAEKAAVKCAQDWVQTSEDSEAWIYRLSHVVSRPDIVPTVEVV